LDYKARRCLLLKWDNTSTSRGFISGLFPTAQWQREFEVREMGSLHPTGHKARRRVNGVEKARRIAILPVQVNVFKHRISINIRGF
jgi:hypothetical protein